MGYNKLTLQQEEQIRSMRKDGKNTKEIQEFLKTTYHLTIPAWKISYVVAKNSSGVASDEKPRRNAAQRKYVKKTAADPQDPAGELIRILRQIQNGYFDMFKFLRGELLKSRGQVYKMQKGAGIAPDKEEEMPAGEVEE